MTLTKTVAPRILLVNNNPVIIVIANKDKLKIKVEVGYLQEIKFKFPINLV